MKLHGELIADGQILLKLTIRFAECQLAVPNGTVIFGLTGGKLRLELENAIIPLETLGLTSRFQTTAVIERQSENSKETERSLEITLKGGISNKNKRIDKEIIKYSDTTCQVYSQGTEETPLWIFSSHPINSIIKGILQQEKLGILQVNYNPCHVKAFFEIQPEDIYPINFTTTNIVKARIVEFSDLKDEENRKDWQIFIEEQLTNPLSQAKLSYEQQSTFSK
jgi:hypothetical protein